MNTKDGFYKILAFLIISIGCKNEAVNDNIKPIIIETNIIKPSDLQYGSVSRVDHDVSWTKVKGKVIDGKTRWVIYSEEPVQIKYNYLQLVVLIPGDNIYVTKKEEELFFSGQGSEKLNILNEIIRGHNPLARPSNSSYDVKNTSDYTNWDKYVDKKLDLQLSILELKAGLLTPFEFEYIKATTINAAELDRMNAFEGLRRVFLLDSTGTRPLDSLSILWDCTQYKHWGKWLRSLPEFYGSLAFMHAFNRMEVQRKFDFNINNDSLSKKDLRTYSCYINARNKFKDNLRERMTVFILDEQVIRELGLLHPTAQIILNDYFKQPGYSEFKKWVKNLQLMAIARNN